MSCLFSHMKAAVSLVSHSSSFSPTLAPGYFKFKSAEWQFNAIQRTGDVVQSRRSGRHNNSLGTMNNKWCNESLNEDDCIKTQMGIITVCHQTSNVTELWG